VARPIAFATLIVIVVFLPLFGMTGIEGRMYQPLAAAVIAAMVAALVLALTLVPIARPCCCGRPGSSSNMSRESPCCSRRLLGCASHQTVAGEIDRDRDVDHPHASAPSPPCLD